MKRVRGRLGSWSVRWLLRLLRAALPELALHERSQVRGVLARLGAD